MKRIFLLFCLNVLLFTINSNAQCHYIPATSTAADTVTWNLSGGSFQSYGCAPIDPNYWVSGSSCVMTATFVTPQNYPGIRVWGMNDDDSAMVYVNGTYYALNSTTAEYLPKVVCGVSPGPDGVYFSNGKIVGSNTNVQGNYSYSDIILHTSNVNSITVYGISGAGWGFAGVVLDCELSTQEHTLSTGPNIFPSPVKDVLYIDDRPAKTSWMKICDAQGNLVMNVELTSNFIDVSKLAPGIYVLNGWTEDGMFVSRKFVKQK